MAGEIQKKLPGHLRRCYNNYKKTLNLEYQSNTEVAYNYHIANMKAKLRVPHSEPVSAIEATVNKPRSHPTVDHAHTTNEVCLLCYPATTTSTSRTTTTTSTIHHSYDERFCYDYCSYHWYYFKQWFIDVVKQKNKKKLHSIKKISSYMWNMWNMWLIRETTRPAQFLFLND